MPMWRCPHCGTPQAETARCWVCHRSSTACGTCRHFRHSVAAQLGYCGLDRSRQPLSGTEIRACWEGWTAGDVGSDAAPTIGPARQPDDHPHREFIEVGAAAESVVMAEAEVGVTAGIAPLPTAPAAPNAPEFGGSLWGDPDR
jgi:hypothetical protein